MSHAKSFVAVVDDDDSVSRAVKRLLRSIGVAANTFKTGDALLDMLDAFPTYRPACIVLDMQMPGLNGLQTQRQLAGTGIPIIFITAHDESDMRAQALAAGAVAYLRKPFEDEVLIRAVTLAMEPDDGA
ncbi:response regulator [Achromobacter aloeverae]|uniref:Response regulator n=1 Tax=Achromobacter aloeverae TaxID=1750518 RepID=A0A4Q1HFF1_9BURK|nr:response regulator [Achromobacter aloeverae]RXN84507.1 response regulator [Achromobacter aloeverae]